MPNNDSVGKKIVEALKKQAETMDEVDTSSFDDSVITNSVKENNDIFASADDDIFAEPSQPSKTANFFDDVEEDKDSFFVEKTETISATDVSSENFEMPSNISVLKKLISQLPSGGSLHTGAQIIKQTMEALGISMKSVLQDAQQVQDSLKISARECQSSIQEYKKQILALEKQSQNYQKQYSALNDLISLFIQTTK